MKAARAGKTLGDLVKETNVNQFMDRGPRDISVRNTRVTRPNIAGSGSYVTRANTKVYNAEHQAHQEAQVKAQKEYVSPEEAQAKQIQYLTRAVNKLQKELKALKDS